MAILSKKEKLEILQRALKRETEKVRVESLKKGLEEGRQEGEILGLQKARPMDFRGDGRKSPEAWCKMVPSRFRR